MERPMKTRAQMRTKSEQMEGGRPSSGEVTAKVSRGKGLMMAPGGALLWAELAREISWVIPMREDPLAGQTHKTSLVLMENPWEDQVLEDRLAMILQTGRNHSLVWDLMEDHITDWEEMTLILQATVKSLTQMVIH